MSRGGDLVDVGRELRQAPHDSVERGRHFEIVIGKDQARLPAEALGDFRGRFGALDLEIHQRRAGRDGLFEKSSLAVQPAVESAAVGCAAASGEDGDAREAAGDAPHHGDAAFRVVERIQAKFEKPLSGLGRAAR